MSYQELKREKMCYKCKSYFKHDANFGYCKKYQCQARSTDTCKVIQEMIKRLESVDTCEDFPYDIIDELKKEYEL